MEKIGFDLDGVLYPFISAVETFCRVNKHFDGTSYEFSSHVFDYFDKYQLDWLAESPIMYYNFVPTKRMMNFLDNVSSKFQIFYLTARPPATVRTTEKYLRDFKFPQNNNLLFTKDKATYARLLKLDYSVEDNPGNAQELSKACLSFLVQTPYNVDSVGDFKVIQSIYDLEGILL